MEILHLTLPGQPLACYAASNCSDASCSIFHYDFENGEIVAQLARLAHLLDFAWRNFIPLCNEVFYATESEMHSTRSQMMQKVVVSGGLTNFMLGGRYKTKRRNFFKK